MKAHSTARRLHPASSGEGSSEIDSLIESALPSLITTYKHIHANPELSGQEEKTAALLARELRHAGCQVVEGIGRYEHHDWPGYGIVAVMKNGEGPTVLMRADMDALPVEEKTGLPYASKARAINRDGKDVGVMHACGHDIHITSLVGAARVLSQMKEDWQGTLVFIGQPGEEGGGGAKAMLNDGAYRLCPKPDYALALHATLQLEAGSIGYVPAHFMASLCEVEVILRGVGSHGSAPELGKDPIVMAAQFILAVQTLVSREKNPFEPAVLTVGTIHGGTASNIIPEEVVLGLTIRSYNDKVRDQLIASVERIARGVALTAGLPEDRSPAVRVKASHPANYNDPALTERVALALKDAMGEPNVLRCNAVMVSEDFGYWGLDGEIPTCMLWLGAADPVHFEASCQSGVPLPSHHSPLFAPLPEPTVRAGVKALTSAVIDLLGR